MAITVNANTLHDFTALDFINIYWHKVDVTVDVKTYDDAFLWTSVVSHEVSMYYLKSQLSDRYKEFDSYFWDFKPHTVRGYIRII